MSIRPLHAFIVAAVCVAGTLGSSLASAAEATAVASTRDREPFVFRYYFDSADLQTDRGTRQVYRTLIARAQRACTYGRSSLLDLYRLDRRCSVALVNDVVRRIGSPALLALHAGSPAANGLAASLRGRHFTGSL